MRKAKTYRKNIPPPGARVKARIVAAGLPLGLLAKKAWMSQSQFSMHIHGKRRHWRKQVIIWQAYRRLSGDGISLEEFWGELLSQENEGEKPAPMRPRARKGDAA